MDLPDLFPGFEARTLHAGDLKLFCRIAGEGPPLLLLHGYPETHVMWHRVAPALAKAFRVIVPDLPGYGWSEVPVPVPDHASGSKRAMAATMVALMEELGHARFAVAGHDRGARVAYRLALDHPARVTRLAILDIVPTHAMWHSMDRALALRVYHWLFLAQPYPLPETLITSEARFYYERTLASWTKAGDLSAFDKGALAHYRAAFGVPERIRAACEDYRAGATVDLAHDEADRAAGRMIEAPLLALWGEAGIPADATGEGGSPLDTWRLWARDVRGHGVPSGHFIPEENPDAVIEALTAFFREDA